MRFCNIFHTQPLAATLPRQTHSLLRTGLERLLPSFPLFLSTIIESGNFLTFLLFSLSEIKLYILRNMRFCSTLHQQTTTPNPTPPGTSPPSEGLGEAAHSPFFFPFGLGKALFSFFKYFRPLPHSLANIENMSTLFSVKIPLFCPSLQQLLQSTNSLLFISSLLYPLIPSCSPSSDVYSLPVSLDHYAFS